jgi:3-mercaptopyruvate sulfurtransferase SseA
MFRWLGAEEAKQIADTLTQWVAEGNPMNEDTVKVTVSGLKYFEDRMNKPHIQSLECEVGHLA